MMNTHLLALQLMVAQGILGAFDTVYHHELTEALPQRTSAGRELSIHATRALIYSVMFIGLAAWKWNGLWALVLLALFGVEIILTLYDFVIEDRTRLLPASERVTHTVLAINGGAFITLLALNTPTWLSAPTALVWEPQGLLSIFLVLCGIGVGLSGMRDALAARQMSDRLKRAEAEALIQFSENSESVLVTGATGFIGQQLVRALLANGQQVTVLSRKPKQAAWQFDGKVRCIQSMSELSAGYPVDVIINLAGARILGLHWTAARQKVLRQSRIGLTESLIEWISTAKKKPRLLLSASAIGYYGIQKQDDVTALTEDAVPQPIFMSQLCQEWEQAANRAKNYGVKVNLMRFGLVLGHQGALPMMMMPIKFGLGGRLGTGKQSFSWIHIRDLLRGIAFLIQDNSDYGTKSDENGAYNFVAPETVSQGQFSQIAAQITHRPCFLPTPAFPVRCLLGEQADLLLEGQRVMPSRLAHLGFKFTYPHLRDALANFI